MPSVISEAREEPDHDGRGEGGRRGGGTASKELCNGSQFNPREERKNERTNGGRRAMIFLRFEKQRSRAARTMAGRKEGRKERARGPQMKTVWGRRRPQMPRIFGNGRWAIRLHQVRRGGHLHTFLPFFSLSMRVKEGGRERVATDRQAGDRALR